MLIKTLRVTVQLKRLYEETQAMTLPGSGDWRHWKDRLRDQDLKIQDILDHSRKPI